MKLSLIKAEFAKHIVIADPWVIDITFASLVGNMVLDHDPLWVMLVAPSSGGKTTLIAPCSGISSVHFVDDLTEKTLLSGFKIKGKESSFLKTVGSGIMAFSDFTNILSKNPVSRSEILSQMKMVYDGNFTKRTGTGMIEWKGKIGFIGAATPDIYSYLETGRSMGERFIYYYITVPSDQEIANKQAIATLTSRELTDTMKGMYQEYFAEFSAYYASHKMPQLSLTPLQRHRVQQAAMFCVNGKATVHTNFKTGKPDSIPNKAGVGRDGRMFDTLLHTLQIMKCYEEGKDDLPVTDEMVDIVEKCAYSAINRERRKILEILVESGSTMTASEIGSKPGLGLEKESVEMYLVPLHAVGLVSKKTTGNRFSWFIDDENTIEFINRVSKVVIDKTPAAGIELPEKTDEEQMFDEYVSPPADETTI